MEKRKIYFTNVDLNGNKISHFKISRGEESIFIWSIFEVLLEVIIDELSKEESDRSTEEFNTIKYIFIDDPISSLDDNNIIEIAINIKSLIHCAKKKKINNLHFILTTHHGLFYNLLYNEFKLISRTGKNHFYQLQKTEKNSYILSDMGDTPFSYHLFLMDIIKTAIETDSIETYHFTLFRNVLEKTASFLGYTKWEDCLFVEDATPSELASYKRRINSFTHNRISDIQYFMLKPQEKNILKKVFAEFEEHFKWNINTEKEEKNV